MFNDANLPETEAWSQLTDDLRRTKDDRNKYAKENSRLKRRIHELEAQNEQYVHSFLIAPSSANYLRITYF
jgi:protein ECT2